MKKIVYQGRPGAFSEEAALKYFGNDISLFGVKNFREMFEGLVSNKFCLAVVPIENSIAGSVSENYDLLYKNNVTVIGEVYLRIRHQLIIASSQKKKDLSKIKSIFSHYKALEQCQNIFLKNPSIKPVEYFDTAGAVEFISKKKDDKMAAIASERAAEVYGLNILKRNIEDNKRNWTRFLIVKKGRSSIEKGSFNKASLAFILPDKQGSLYRCLEIFSKAKINMSKIESRPIPDRAFEYVFYIDVVFDPKEINSVKTLISDLKKRAKKVKVLGSYKRASI